MGVASSRPIRRRPESCGSSAKVTGAQRPSCCPMSIEVAVGGIISIAARGSGYLIGPSTSSKKEDDPMTSTTPALPDSVRQALGPEAARDLVVWLDQHLLRAESAQVPVSALMARQKVNVLMLEHVSNLLL